MKECIGLIGVILTLLILVSCNSKTALQEVTGATNRQGKVIENWLSDANVTYEKVSISTNPLIEGMDENFTAYDLMSSDGITYVLILRKSDNDFTAVLDSEGKLLGGLVDNVVTPALFDNGYIYSNSKKQEIVQQLANTFTYDSQSGMLQFIIPEQLPEQYKLYIHVSGRLKMADGAMSFHAFEEESENYLWELGKTYTYEIGENALLNGLVVIGLIEGNSSELQYETSVEIDENGNITIIDS